MSDTIGIKVEGLWKSYRRGVVSSQTIRERISGFRNDFFSRRQHESFWALKDINFEITEGDVLGIIGRNGAGKSTLLKILSQISAPDKGRFEIHGRVASLLEVGTGFHMELTGMENIYLNGSLLGMTRKEISSRIDEIIAFSGVDKFINTPVKHYSSGMKVRLAFSVAAFVETEVLIIDEVLAVGDLEFQEKCLGKMHDVSESGRCVLFVSHNLPAMKSLCNKGLVLQKGESVGMGLIDEAISIYTDMVYHQIDEINETPGVFKMQKHMNKQYDANFGVKEVRLYCNGNLSNEMLPNEPMSIEIETNDQFDIEQVYAGFVIKDVNGNALIGINNKDIGQVLHDRAFRSAVLRIDIPKLPIYGEGKYLIDVMWGNNNSSHDVIHDACAFRLNRSDIYKTANILDPAFNKVVVNDISFQLNILK